MTTRKRTVSEVRKSLGDSTSTARKVAWWCVRLVVIVVPLAMSNISWLGGPMAALTFDQFEVPKLWALQALTLVALGAWSWDLLRRGGRFRYTPILWGMLTLVVFVALSTAFSVHWPTALLGQYRRFEGLQTFVTYGVLFLLVVQLVDSTARIRDLARTLVVAGVIVATYGLMQFLGFEPLKWGTLPFEVERSFSSFGNPDPLGGFLILPLSVALGSALAETTARSRLIYFGAAGLMGVVLLATFTRGAWIGGLFALAIVVFAAIRARARVAVGEWAVAGTALTVGALVAVRSLSSSSEVTNIAARVASTFNFTHITARTRFLIWRAALRSIADRPLLGAGPDTFRLLFPRLKSAAYSQAAGHAELADNAHNYPLHLAAGIGVSGILACYAVIIWTLVRSFRDAFPQRAATISRLAMAGMWAGIVGYLVHLLFGISAIGSTAVMWVCLAALASPGARVIHVRAPKWGVPASWFVSALLLCVLTAASMAVVADYWYARGFMERDQSLAVQAYTRAARLNPLNDRYRSQVGVGWRDLMYTAIDEAGRLQQSGQDPMPAVQAANRYFLRAEKSALDVIEFVPQAMDNYTFLVNLYNKAGVTLDSKYLESAVGIAEAAVRQAPNDADLHYHLAVAYASTRRFRDALVAAEKAARLDENWADPPILIGDLNRELGNLEQARTSYELGLALAAAVAGKEEALDPSRVDRARQVLASIEASLSAGSP